MSDGQGETLRLLEYLFIGIIAFLSTFVVLRYIDTGRLDLALLGAVIGIGIIALVGWAIFRTSRSN